MRVLAGLACGSTERFCLALMVVELNIKSACMFDDDDEEDDDALFKSVIEFVVSVNFHSLAVLSSLNVPCYPVKMIYCCLIHVFAKRSCVIFSRLLCYLSLCLSLSQSGRHPVNTAAGFVQVLIFFNTPVFGPEHVDR